MPRIYLDACCLNRPFDEQSMNVAAMSLEQIRQHGIAVLAKELGPVGMIRFLQQYDSGSGDYSEDRHQWLPEDVPAIVAAIRERTKQ